MGEDDSASKSKTAIRAAIITGIFAVCTALITVFGGPAIQRLLLSSPTPARVVVAVTPNTPTATPSLTAPVPVYPECGHSIKYPGDDRLILIWEKVEGASHYTIEVDCYGCGGVAGNWYSLSMGSSWHIERGLGWDNRIYFSKLHQESGGAPLRWRVWAIDSEGFPGEKSHWCQVTFIGE